MRTFISTACLLLSSVAVGCFSEPPPRFEQAPACAAMMECYFAAGGTNLAEVEAFEQLFADPSLVPAVYGDNGSCWTDREQALLCEDRCRGLLLLDCLEPFAASESCPQACDPSHATVCSIEGGAATHCPVGSSCTPIDVESEEEPIAGCCTRPDPDDANLRVGDCSSRLTGR